MHEAAGWIGDNEEKRSGMMVEEKKRFLVTHACGVVRGRSRLCFLENRDVPFFRN